MMRVYGDWGGRENKIWKDEWTGVVRVVWEKEDAGKKFIDLVATVLAPNPWHERPGFELQLREF